MGGRRTGLKAGKVGPERDFTQAKKNSCSTGGRGGGGQSRQAWRQARYVLNSKQTPVVQWWGGEADRLEGRQGKPSKENTKQDNQSFNDGRQADRPEGRQGRPRKNNTMQQNQWFNRGGGQEDKLEGRQAGTYTLAHSRPRACLAMCSEFNPS